MSGLILPSETLLKLYIIMKRIRGVELRIESEYHKDEMKTPIHLCNGQEAIAAGMCLNLDDRDYVFSNHRGHGHYVITSYSIHYTKLYDLDTYLPLLLPVHYKDEWGLSFRPYDTRTLF